MIEWVKIIIDFFVRVGSVPYVYAPVLGLILSLVFTQFSKFCLPKCWPDSVVRFIAAAFGFGSTFAMTGDILGFILAIIIAFMAPWFYPVLTRLIYKRWPWFRSVLSRDGGSNA